LGPSTAIAASPPSSWSSGPSTVRRRYCEGGMAVQATFQRPSTLLVYASKRFFSSVATEKRLKNSWLPPRVRICGHPRSGDRC
jgi:hypothetical protein